MHHVFYKKILRNFIMITLYILRMFTRYEHFKLCVAAITGLIFENNRAGLSFLQ